jgi:hypothetical protein
VSAWKILPRAERRKILEAAIRADPKSARQHLEGIKKARDRYAKALADMDETIQVTEALLGEVHA